MKYIYGKNSGLGKADQILAKIKNEIKLSISQDDLINKKYLDLMRKLPFFQKTIFKVNGVKCKQHPVYDYKLLQNVLQDD